MDTSKEKLFESEDSKELDNSNQHESENQFSLNQNNVGDIQVFQPLNVGKFLAKDEIIKFIKEFNSPIHQLLTLKNPTLEQEHTRILERFSNDENASLEELDQFIEGINQMYEIEQQYEFLGLLFFFIDHFGVSLITRPKFNKIVLNIIDCPCGEGEALIIILISQLIFQKLSPLGQDTHNFDLQEFFEMHKKGQSHIKIESHMIQMIQQPYDCLYVTSLLVSNEVCRQNNELQGGKKKISLQFLYQSLDQDSNIDQKLLKLYETSNKCFKQLEIPKAIPSNSTPQQEDEQIIQLYSLLQKTKNVLDYYIDFNDLAIPIQQVLKDQEILLKDLSSQFIKTYPLLKQKFAQQRQNQSSNIPSIEQALFTRTSFAMNEILKQDEDQTYEYKNYKWPIVETKSIMNLQSVICSFLNTKGGYLFFGIDDETKQAMGMYLTSKQRDEFKLLIQGMMDQINPQTDMVENPLLQVSFIPIQNHNKKNVPGYFVVRVTVQQGEVDRFYTYYNQISKTITGNIRLDGQKKTYNYPEIQDMIYKNCKIPRAKVSLLKVLEPDRISDILVASPVIQNQMPRQLQQQSPTGKPKNEVKDKNHKSTFEVRDVNYKSFVVLLTRDETINRIEKIAKSLLGPFLNESQYFKVNVESDKEFHIIFNDRNKSEMFCSFIQKNSSSIRSNPLIKSIKFRSNMIYTGLTQKQEKIQVRESGVIIFAFLNVKKSQGQNLVSFINSLLKTKKIQKNIGLRQFEHSIIVGFGDKYNFDMFYLEVYQQTSIIKQYGFKFGLLGGVATLKISYKNIDEITQQTLMANFKILFNIRQNDSGFIECKDEQVAAEVYDVLKGRDYDVNWQLDQKIKFV